MQLGMPPRAALTGSFSVSDENNVVVCPLRNQDGSACRKRCTGEKRYRSMQEHIRRAHPEHYISKLPATEESFLLMVNTPPQERPPPPPQPNTSAGPQGYGDEQNAYYDGDHSSSTPRNSDEWRRASLLPAASAAATLASLHSHRRDYEWDSDPEAASEPDSKSYRPRARFAPTSLDQHMNVNEPYYTSAPLHHELLPSSLARSPPGRSSTLPPAPRSIKPNRRKDSVGQNGRRPKHDRTKSKEGRRLSHERKAYSAEPQTAAALYGKRWEDLIDAAASATEEDSSLTPVCTEPTGVVSEYLTPQVPQSPNQSPHMMPRSSLPPPPFVTSHFSSQMQSYAASPLHKALTPPPTEMADLQAFPSVESSIESGASGAGFHIASQGLSDSSPTYLHPVQIYCAACRKLSVLKESYACSECICGLCQDCVDVLVSEQTKGRAAKCPRCHAVGGKYKPFQLDIR